MSDQQREQITEQFPGVARAFGLPEPTPTPDRLETGRVRQVVDPTGRGWNHQNRFVYSSVIFPAGDLSGENIVVDATTGEIGYGGEDTEQVAPPGRWMLLSALSIRYSNTVGSSASGSLGWYFEIDSTSSDVPNFNPSANGNVRMELTPRFEFSVQPDGAGQEHRLVPRGNGSYLTTSEPSSDTTSWLPVVPTPLAVPPEGRLGVAGNFFDLEVTRVKAWGAYLPDDVQPPQSFRVTSNK